METISIILLGLLLVGVVVILFKPQPTQTVGDSAANALFEQQIATLRADVKERDEKIETLTRQLSNAQTRLENEGVALQQLKEQEEEMRKAFRLEFEKLAQDILDAKTQTIQEQSKSQIGLILNPVKDSLIEFEKRINETYRSENRERVELKTELTRLQELNQQLSSDATNLATALKGDNKSQGAWGEVILERVLERSGLTEGVEYKSQHTTRNAEEDKIRPDVIILLPDNKHLVVDSKVSLTAYSRFVNATNEPEREAALKAHIESIRSHVKLLSQKNYASATGLNSPEFVIIFTPIEAAFSAAIQSDPELFNFAWEKNIVITSPTTLLATLKAVSNIWLNERRNQNTQAIVVEAGRLFDKFESFLKSMKTVGEQLRKANEEHDAAMGKLATGKGNIISKMKLLQQLGAKTTKQLDIPHDDHDAEDIAETE
jgi:DNA recombination protein RmuC